MRQCMMFFSRSGSWCLGYYLYAKRCFRSEPFPLEEPQTLFWMQLSKIISGLFGKTRLVRLRAVRPHLRVVRPYHFLTMLLQKINELISRAPHKLHGIDGEN